MPKELPIEIDKLHALQDFLDAYDNHAEMVTNEAIANAIDVGSDKVDITLKENWKGEKIISFYNNGPPMTPLQFKNYHVIARSSKKKGQGIGFAGIGAKVYLAAWRDTHIRTDTTDGKKSLCSKMYPRDADLFYQEVKPSLKKPGTEYTVKLEPADYDYLQVHLEGLIQDIFNPALRDTLTITLNKKNISAWNPETEFNEKLVVKVKEKKFPVHLIVAKEDIDSSKLFIQYHVSGKIITTKKPEWVDDVKSAYRSRIHAYVDAMTLSDQLNLIKDNFKSSASRVTGQIYKEVDRKLFVLLEKGGYIGEKDVQKWEKSGFTKFIEKIFKNPKFAFLNPEARGGRGPGAGAGTGGNSGDSSKKSGTKSGENDAEKKPRSGGGSFKVGFVDRPDNKKDGWIDPPTNQVMVNTGHPLFIKYENNPQARNQRIASIITSVLIKNAASKMSMDPSEAFELQNEILTLGKDEVW